MISAGPARLDCGAQQTMQAALLWCKLESGGHTANIGFGASDDADKLMCSRRSPQYDWQHGGGWEAEQDEFVKVGAAGIRARLTRNTEAWFAPGLKAVEVTAPGSSARIELTATGSIVSKPSSGASHAAAPLVLDLTQPRHADAKHKGSFPCAVAAASATSPAPAAPAPAASPDPTAAVSSLDTAKAARKWLTAAGFSSRKLAPLAKAGKVSAKLYTANLDRDPQPEAVAVVKVKDAAQDGPRTDYYYLVWVDRDAHGSRIAGRRRIDIGSCIADGSFALKLEPVHNKAFSDVIVDEDNSPTCNGGYVVTTLRELWTLERGKPSRLIRHKDYTMADRMSQRVVHQSTVLRFKGAPPRRAEILQGRHVNKTLRFDPKTFRYR